MTPTRRSFLAGSGVVLVGCAARARGAHGAAPARDDAEEEVTPAEDLMREHGVLRRVMYLYDEAIDRFGAGREVPLDALAGGAGIIRHVIEDYHEQLEEQHVFPEFERANKLVELTTVLRKQHAVGRSLTDRVLALAKAPLADADRATLVTTLRAFNHMYRAHASREDTVLFPELRGLVGGKAYAELGEQLEEKETELLGDHGFEHAVADVAKLEEAFGVDDLAKLTP
jgi:hemerythrin-like domain-containing protein